MLTGYSKGSNGCVAEAESSGALRTLKRISCFWQDDDTLEGRLKQRVPGGMYNDFLGAEHADSGPRRKYRRQDSNRRVPCIVWNSLKTKLCRAHDGLPVLNMVMLSITLFIGTYAAQDWLRAPHEDFGLNSCCCVHSVL